MSDIILICKICHNSHTNVDELRVDRAFDVATGKAVVVSDEHPSRIGGVFDSQMGEWVIRG